MSWAWFAVLDPVEGAGAAESARARAAAVDAAGTDLLLAAWPAGRKPVREAVRIDASVVDPDGPPAEVSLLLLDRGREPLFDDPAVSRALQRVLEDPPPAAVTTFVRDASHFAGALTARRRDPAFLADDPFLRLGPARRLRVGAGLLGEVGAPVLGPVTQRYAGRPWPAAGFEG